MKPGKSQLKKASRDNDTKITTFCFGDEDQTTTENGNKKWKPEAQQAQEWKQNPTETKPKW